MKRLFDLIVAGTALVISAPILLVAMLAIRFSSPGPMFYVAERAGVGGRPFRLFKLRTMHQSRCGTGSAITSAEDPRVFRAGNILRKLKVDELPQLWNILRGDMSVVGPRPEAMSIVKDHYDALGQESLTVRPGLTGIGSIYYYTHGEQKLVGTNPEQLYLTELLPVKLAMEVLYLRRANVVRDMAVILKTALTIAQIGAGRREFPDPPELREAEALLARRRSTADSDLRRAA